MFVRPLLGQGPYLIDGAIGPAHLFRYPDFGSFLLR